MSADDGVTAHAALRAAVRCSTVEHRGGEPKVKSIYVLVTYDENAISDDYIEQSVMDLPGVLDTQVVDDTSVPG